MSCVCFMFCTTDRRANRSQKTKIFNPNLYIYLYISKYAFSCSWPLRLEFQLSTYMHIYIFVYIRMCMYRNKFVSMRRDGFVDVKCGRRRTWGIKIPL